MRKIDADAFAFEVVNTVVPDDFDTSSYLAGMSTVLDMVDNAPTVDGWIDIDMKRAMKHDIDINKKVNVELTLNEIAELAVAYQYANPADVQAAINASFVADREKEAQKVKNEAVIAKAQADAEAQRIEADAKSDANKTISESLTKELIEYEKVQKWNGVQPQVVGNSSTIVDMDD